MLKVVLIFLILVTLLYFSGISYLLRYEIDRVVLIGSESGAVKSVEKIFAVVEANGNEVLIRKYGPVENRCVVFFPGRRGGIHKYEKELFSYLLNKGISVYALSYPGQDGAEGKTKLLSLPGAINLSLKRINKTCSIDNSVFVGRSLGATVASYLAPEWKPKGMVLEGVSPSLSEAIKVRMYSKWYLYPAALLPIGHLMQNDFKLAPKLSQYMVASGKVTIFQGEEDIVTPLEQLEPEVAKLHGLKLIEINGAGHSDTYIKARVAYLEEINRLLGL